MFQDFDVTLNEAKSNLDIDKTRQRHNGPKEKLAKLADVGGLAEVVAIEDAKLDRRRIVQLSYILHRCMHLHAPGRCILMFILYAYYVDMI